MLVDIATVICYFQISQLFVITTEICYFQISHVGCHRYRNMLLSDIPSCLLSLQKYVTFRYLKLVVITKVICYFRYLLFVVITTVIFYFQISPDDCHHYSNVILSDISCWLSSLQ